jgi:hypothetical protein
MLGRPAVLALVLVCAAALASCYAPPPETMTLKGGMLTIDNHTKEDWSNVEIWLNTYYRMQVKEIPAGGRVQTPLDFFVAGLGQRFSYAHTQIRDLRLTAKRPDGAPIEIKKEFEVDGLQGVAKQMGKKK